jgi:hypothetical protein
MMALAWLFRAVANEEPGDAGHKGEEVKDWRGEAGKRVGCVTLFCSWRCVYRDDVVILKLINNYGIKAFVDERRWCLRGN